MAKGTHQVNTANNSFVNAEDSGTITFYVDRANEKPVMIALQLVLNVPACGTNNLLSFFSLMGKGVTIDFKLNEATASLCSVLIYEAPLINSLFVLKASALSVSKASAVIDDPPSSEVSESYSNIRPAVDDKDTLVWPAQLGHLSLADIKRLQNTVRGIKLHAKTPLTCTCEACIVGKMFRKPFQPSEDKAKTRLHE